MALPFYLAMTLEEMEEADTLPPCAAWMAWQGALPTALPPNAMLILTDRLPCRDPDRLAAEIKALNCGSILLDFEHAPEPETMGIASALSKALSCPVAAPPGFSVDPDCPVFLPPCPLHVPLADYLRPWQGRDIWLDVTAQQQIITVTQSGTRYGPTAPADRQDGGWPDEVLQCRCISEMSEDAVRFILFDTPDTLKAKLNRAETLGISRAVGLYQELGGKL